MRIEISHSIRRLTFLSISILTNMSKEISNVKAVDCTVLPLSKRQKVHIKYKYKHKSISASSIRIQFISTMRVSIEHSTYLLFPSNTINRQHLGKTNNLCTFDTCYSKMTSEGACRIVWRKFSLFFVVRSAEQQIGEYVEQSNVVRTSTRTCFHVEKVAIEISIVFVVSFPKRYHTSCCFYHSQSIDSIEM